MKGTILILLVVSYMLNALADAIDHAKGGQVLYEVWHLLKAISYTVPFTITLILLGVDWKVYGLLWLALWLWWEITYKTARRFNFYRVDNALRIPFFKRLWE